MANGYLGSKGANFPKWMQQGMPNTTPAQPAIPRGPGLPGTGSYRPNPWEVQGPPTNPNTNFTMGDGNFTSPKPIELTGTMPNPRGLNALRTASNVVSDTAAPIAQAAEASAPSAWYNAGTKFAGSRAGSALRGLGSAVGRMGVKGLVGAPLGAVATDMLFPQSTSGMDDMDAIKNWKPSMDKGAGAALHIQNPQHGTQAWTDWQNNRNAFAKDDATQYPPAAAASPALQYGGNVGYVGLGGDTKMKLEDIGEAGRGPSKGYNGLANGVVPGQPANSNDLIDNLIARQQGTSTPNSVPNAGPAFPTRPDTPSSGGIGSMGGLQGGVPSTPKADYNNAYSIPTVAFNGDGGGAGYGNGGGGSNDGTGGGAGLGGILKTLQSIQPVEGYGHRLANIQGANGTWDMNRSDQMNAANSGAQEDQNRYNQQVSALTGLGTAQMNANANQMGHMIGLQTAREGHAALKPLQDAQAANLIAEAASRPAQTQAAMLKALGEQYQYDPAMKANLETLKAYGDKAAMGDPQAATAYNKVAKTIAMTTGHLISPIPVAAQ